MSHGLQVTSKELAKQEKEGKGAIPKGRLEIRLGGVSCQFRKEIKPFEKFEVWTRILCWDQKWLYMICHVVKPGVVRPEGYTLQPWRKIGRKQRDDGEAERNNEPDQAPSSPPQSAIFATGIAKYVCKKGRLTIPPERILQASKLLPTKPADRGTTSPATSISTPVPESTSNTAAVAATIDQITPGNTETVVVESLKAAADAAGGIGRKDGDEEWTWERVEAERKRGMKIAEGWAALEGLNAEFQGEGAMVLGRW